MNLGKIISIVVSSLFFSCAIEFKNERKERTEDESDQSSEVHRKDDSKEAPRCQESDRIYLSLRVHLMRGVNMIHSGVSMTTSHITVDIVKNSIIPEVNNIYRSANIEFNSEGIIEEQVIKGENFLEDLQIVLNAKRDSNGRSDPNRLPPLYRMMDPKFRSQGSEDDDLFHIYLFPFIGNTSQGNAMRGFGYHSVVGVWSNKHNNGGVPRKVNIVGANNNGLGSLSRTIAHEQAHVLGLNHNDCTSTEQLDCLMNGSSGYDLTAGEVTKMRSMANERKSLCK